MKTILTKAKLIHAVLFLFLFIILPSFTNAAVPDNVIKSTVKIYAINKTGVSWGSGVIIDPFGHIITNKHVVGEASRVAVCIKIEATKPVDCRYIADVIKKYDNQDIALLELLTVLPNNLRTSFIPKPRVLNYVLPRNTPPLSFGEDIYIVGFPDSGGPTVNVTKGIISGWTADKYIKTDAKASAGNSGGGVFTTDGKLAGILTWVQAGKHENIAIAIPITSSYISAIFDALKELGYYNNSYDEKKVINKKPRSKKIVTNKRRTEPRKATYKTYKPERYYSQNERNKRLKKYFYEALNATKLVQANSYLYQYREGVAKLNKIPDITSYKCGSNSSIISGTFNCKCDKSFEWANNTDLSCKRIKAVKTSTFTKKKVAASPAINKYYAQNCVDDVNTRPVKCSSYEKRYTLNLLGKDFPVKKDEKQKLVVGKFDKLAIRLNKIQGLAERLRSIKKELKNLKSSKDKIKLMRAIILKGNSTK